jgi:hypothetical protein
VATKAPQPRCGPAYWVSHGIPQARTGGHTASCDRKEGKVGWMRVDAHVGANLFGLAVWVLGF